MIQTIFIAQYISQWNLSGLCRQDIESLTSENVDFYATNIYTAIMPFFSLCLHLHYLLWNLFAYFMYAVHMVCGNFFYVVRYKDYWQILELFCGY